jgi:hypothetical protein
MTRLMDAAPDDPAAAGRLGAAFTQILHAIPRDYRREEFPEWRSALADERVLPYHFSISLFLH